MEEQKNNIKIDEHYTEATGWKKVLLIAGGFCFIAIATFTMIHLGFVEDKPGNQYYEAKPFLTRQNLWIVNLIIAAVGGALLGYKRLLIGIFSGVVAGVAITAATLGYLSFRENILMAEIVIPLLSGLSGAAVYSMLTKEK